MDFSKIFDITVSFSPITLAEMKQVSLMNRIDTKYIVSLAQLAEILEKLKDSYDIQINASDSRIASYQSIYLDTKEHDMYICHETGRAVREKIRYRTYSDTHETFLELKKKNNHGLTSKKRIFVPDCTQNDPKLADSFLAEKSKFLIENLHPHLQVDFYRITLVNKQKTERLTLDFNLSFSNFETSQTAQLNKIGIIELKRNGFTHSPAKLVLTELQVREKGFSKYCIGCALTNPFLRRNELKEKLRYIEKLNQNSLC